MEKLLSLWIEYGKGKINTYKLVENIHKLKKLQEVSLDVNYQCNFSCSYCSYGFNKLHERELSLEEWKRVVNECMGLGAKLFALAGKEPLANNRFKDILDYIKLAGEKEGRDIISGLVTNGWFLKEKIDLLAGTGLSYLDVSIDGCRETHDSNRRQGSYDRAIEGLLIAQKNAIAEKLFVSSVVHARNCDDLPVFIKDLYSRGIKNFSLSLLYPTAKAPSKLLFNKKELNMFLTRQLPETMNTIPKAPDLQIVVDIFTSSLPFLRDMVMEGTINMDDVYIDDIGSLFTYDELDNGCTVYKRFSLDHIVYGRSIKITADGYCMVNYESLTKREYWKYSVGNIKEASIAVLYDRLFEEGSYIYKLANEVKNEVCSDEPCFPICLGKNGNCSFKNSLKTEIIREIGATALIV